MPLYGFKCPNGHSTEGLRGYTVTSISCPRCGEEAIRQGFNLVSFEMRDGATEVKDKDGRVNVTRFKEASEEIAHGYEQVEKREGVKVASPNLYRLGVERAKRRGAKIRV